MVMDALRGYVQLANGLTEVTRQRAQQAAKALIQQTGAENLTAGLSTRVGELTDEIIATSKSNQQLLQAIVANEVEGAVARLGFVRSEEVAALRRRLETVERDLADLVATSSPVAKKAPAKKAPAKKTPAKKAPAMSTPAKKTVGEKPTPAKKSAQKSAQKKAAQKSAAKRS